MTMHRGYLLIADVSGYTAFLTQSELDHANPILRALLGALIEQVADPLHLWRMDGDAVLAYTTDRDFPTGEGFLTICENLYNTFSTLRQDMIANTTCTCTACANLRNLDLKILAHHGMFEEMQFGSVVDISGPDVILVHRMAKTGVQEATGIRSYAMFSDAAIEEMGIPRSAVCDYTTSFEHFGEVRTHVYDLRAAWERVRERRERHFLSEEDGLWTIRWTFDATPQLLWELLTDARSKERWMLVNRVSATRQGERLGSGTRYHCAHAVADFVYSVTDWEPPRYFSTRLDEAAEGAWRPETYELTPVDGGTQLRYTLSYARDQDGTPLPELDAPTIGFLAQYWPEAFATLDGLLAERGANGPTSSASGPPGGSAEGESPE